MTDTPLISIVDDDSWARSGLEDLVSSLGYTARTFASSEQFVESGSISDTACLITDLNMPGLSGLELQSLLRSEGHRTPIIFVTGYPSERDRARALDGGAVCFLAKPFDEQRLIDWLNVAIAR